MYVKWSFEHPDHSPCQSLAPNGLNHIRGHMYSENQEKNVYKKAFTELPVDGATIGMAYSSIFFKISSKSGRLIGLMRKVSTPEPYASR